MSIKRSSPPTSSDSTELVSLPKIEPLSPLRFPTFAELVEEDRAKQETSSVSRKLNGLFDGMLGDVTPLLADYQEHPEKYGKETHNLLEQLMSGSTSVAQLTTTERRLLNLATFDFFQQTPSKPKERQTAAPPARGAGRAARKVRESKRPGPRPGIDVPETELPAYWWLR